MKNQKSKWVSKETLSAGLIYGFLFGYILSFLFEGKVYVALEADIYFDTKSYVMPAILFHVLGIMFGAILDWIQKYSRVLQGISYGICLAATLLFAIQKPIFCEIVILTASFFAGVIATGWGQYYKRNYTGNTRTKGIACGVFLANLLMLVAGYFASVMWTWIGFGIAFAYLLLSFLLFLKNQPMEQEEASGDPKNPKPRKTMFVFLLYILIINIDSGLMYSLVMPSFQSLGTITEWYWAIPYMVAVGALFLLPEEKTHYSKMLYLASAMIAVSFVLYLFLAVTPLNFIIVDTFLLGASGILDITWAGKLLGKEMDSTKKPIFLFGLGLSANAGGVLLGEVLGNGMTHSGMNKASAVVLALFIICITLIILPTLIRYLQQKSLLTVAMENASKAPEEKMFQSFSSTEPLTKREEEIFRLLLAGKSNEEISVQLCISQNTVKTHVRNVLKKYNVNNRTELMSKILNQNN